MCSPLARRSRCRAPSRRAVAEYFARGSTALALLSCLRAPDDGYVEATRAFTDPESWEIVFPRTRYARPFNCLALFLGTPCGVCPAEAMASAVRGGTHDAAWAKLRGLLSETRGDPILVRYLAAIVAALHPIAPHFFEHASSWAGVLAHLMCHTAFADVLCGILLHGDHDSEAAEALVVGLARCAMRGEAPLSPDAPSSPLAAAALSSFRDVVERCCNTLGDPEPPPLATCLLRFLACSGEFTRAIARDLGTPCPLFVAPVLSTMTVMASVGTCGCVATRQRCSSVDATPLFIGPAGAVLREFAAAFDSCGAALVVAHVDLLGALACRGCAAIDAALVQSGALRSIAAALAAGRLRGIAACKAGLVIRYVPKQAHIQICIRVCRTSAAMQSRCRTNASNALAITRYVLMNRSDEDRLFLEMLHALDDATAAAAPRASADLRAIVTELQVCTHGCMHFSMRPHATCANSNATTGGPRSRRDRRASCVGRGHHGSPLRDKRCERRRVARRAAEPRRDVPPPRVCRCECCDADGRSSAPADIVQGDRQRRRAIERASLQRR